MKQKLKVLILNSCVSGGGAGRSLASYLEYEGKEIEAHVVMPKTGVIDEEIRPYVKQIYYIAEFVERIQKNNYRWVQTLDWAWLHFVMNGYSLLVARHKIAKIVRALQPDLIYCNHMLAKVVGVMVSVTTRTSIVLHARNFHNTALGRRFYQFLGRLRTVKSIICNSQATSLLYRKHSDEKVTVVHNFINLLRFRSLPSGERIREALAIPNDAVVIGFTGRIVKWKGLDLLIQAFADLYSRFPQTYLCILGDNDGGLHRDLKAEYVDLAQKLGISDRTVFVPFREDIRPVLCTFDVLALPSREPEPFGRVVIEAMAMGIPPVVAGHGGVMEIVENNVEGKVFTPRSVKSLSAALAELILKPEFRTALGENAEFAVQQRFSGHVLAPQITRALKRAADTNPSVGRAVDKKQQSRTATKTVPARAARI